MHGNGRTPRMMLHMVGFIPLPLYTMEAEYWDGALTKKKGNRASEMAQRLMAAATKPDNLSHQIFRFTLMVEGEM